MPALDAKPQTGYGSVVVNGQLLPIPVASAYEPLAFGAAYTGPDMWPRQGVYNNPPVMPSPEMQSAMAPATYGGTSTMPTAVSDTGNPFHPTKSPVLWAVGLLVFSLAMLHFVHFKE